MERLNAFSSLKEGLPIDECFMDMSGTKLIYPDPIATAYELKDRIKNELGFTVNVGIGRNKLGDKMGIQAYRYANGLDDSPVKEQPDEPKGYSNEVTLEDDVISIDQADRILLALADSVTSHMRKDGVKAYCVAVKIRYLDFRTRSHQRKLSEPTDVSGEVYEVAKELLKELWKDRRPLRLMGVALTDVSDDSEPVQMTMFREEEQLSREKGQKLDKAIDSLRDRYGSGIITQGSLMEFNIKVGKKNER